MVFLATVCAVFFVYNWFFILVGSSVMFCASGVVQFVLLNSALKQAQNRSFIVSASNSMRHVVCRCRAGPCNSYTVRLKHCGILGMSHWHY